MGVSKCPPASESLSLLAPAPPCSNLQARLAALSTGGRAASARARSSPITAVWAELKLVTDRRAGDENLTPPIRLSARAFAPYFPQPPLPRWFLRGKACGNFPTFLRGCNPEAGTIQAACSPVSVCKVGKKLPEAPLFEASPQTGEVYGAPLWETDPGPDSLRLCRGAVI